MSAKRGESYTVREGDTFTSIATEAYGNKSAWPVIWKYNRVSPELERSDGIDSSLITGQVIYIPEQPELGALDVKDAVSAIRGVFDKDEIGLVIGGYLIADITEASITKSLNNLVFKWEATFPWTPGIDQDIDNLLIPGKYPRAFVTIGDKLIASGKIYSVRTSLSPEGLRECTVIGGSSTTALADSNPRPPYEYNSIGLLQFVKDLVSPFGLQVITSETDIEQETDFYNRLVMSRNEVVASQLYKAARMRGVLVSTNEYSDVVLSRGNQFDDSDRLSVLAESVNINSLIYKYEGRSLYRSYEAVSSLPMQIGEQEVLIDKNIYRIAHKAISDSDNHIGNAAQWVRSKQYRSAIQLEVNVPGWYTEDNYLWECNTFVDITAPTAFLSSQLLLIDAVNFKKDDSGRTTSNLRLIQPEVLRGEEVPYIWESVTVS